MNFPFKKKNERTKTDVAWPIASFEIFRFFPLQKREKKGKIQQPSHQTIEIQVN